MIKFSNLVGLRLLRPSTAIVPRFMGSSDAKNYQDLLDTKNKIMLDMTIRPQKFKRLHPNAVQVHSQLTQTPEPLKHKLQALPEGHNPLIPLGNTEHLPFFIQRSKSGNLPIYRDYKHGRMKKMTLVRKISGDVEELMIELKKICSNTDIEAKVGCIVIKGLHKQVLTDYLIRLGF